jgi:hypothetical protein
MLKIIALAALFGTASISSAFSQLGPIAPQPALFTLPIGTVLMFDQKPPPTPGWKECGVIKVSQGDKKDGEKHDHEYFCFHKVS